MGDEVTLEDVCEAMRELMRRVELLADEIHELREKVDAGKSEKHTHHHYPKRDTLGPPPYSDWH